MPEGDGALAAADAASGSSFALPSPHLATGQDFHVEEQDPAAATAPDTRMGSLGLKMLATSLHAQARIAVRVHRLLRVQTPPRQAGLVAGRADAALAETASALHWLRRLAERLAAADPPAAAAERATLRAAAAPWLEVAQQAVAAGGDAPPVLAPYTGLVWEDPSEFLCRALLAPQEQGATAVAAARAEHDAALAACLCAAATQRAAKARESRGAVGGDGGAAKPTSRASAVAATPSGDNAAGSPVGRRAGCKGLARAATAGRTDDWDWPVEVEKLVLLWWAGWATSDEV